jgi:hypothetical protein
MGRLPTKRCGSRPSCAARDCDQSCSASRSVWTTRIRVRGWQDAQRLSPTIDPACALLRTALTRGEVRRAGRPPACHRSFWRFSARSRLTRRSPGEPELAAAALQAQATAVSAAPPPRPAALLVEWPARRPPAAAVVDRAAGLEAARVAAEAAVRVAMAAADRAGEAAAQAAAEAVGARVAMEAAAPAAGTAAATAAAETAAVAAGTDGVSPAISAWAEAKSRVLRRKRLTAARQARIQFRRAAPAVLAATQSVQSLKCLFLSLRHSRSSPAGWRPGGIVYIHVNGGGSGGGSHADFARGCAT